MGLLDKWNKEGFTIYDKESYSVLQLLDKTGKWFIDIIKDLDNKTDLNGDHKGSWQGLEKPTLSEEGMRATVEKLNNDYSKLENNINDFKNELEKTRGFVINVENPPSPLQPLLFDNTDESKKLQDIINYVNDNYQGGIIEFPCKKLTLSKTVALPLGSKSITLKGKSSDSYNGTIFASNTNTTILNIDGYNHKIENIAFTNTLSTSVRGSDALGIGIYILPTESNQACDNLVIENCSFFRLQYGILNKSQNIIIQNNLFSYIKECAFRSIGKTTYTESGTYGQDYCNRDIMIINNRFHGLNKYGIIFNFGQFHKEILIDSNLFDDVECCITGMLIRSNITNNVMGRVRGTAINIDNGKNVETINISNNTIIGISGLLDDKASAPNTSAGNYETGDGISITSRNAIINGNAISHKVGNGINVNQYSEYTVISNNSIINCDNYNTNSKSAININSDIVLVTGNVIRRIGEGKHYYSINAQGSSIIGDSTNNILGTSASGKPYNPKS